MKLWARLLSVALIALLSVGALAGSDPNQAQELLENARKQSDIRSPSAPAFRLKATFTVVTADLSTVEGTYTETWSSNTQWRRETVLGASRRLEVGGATKRRVLDIGTPLPAEVQRLPGVLDLTPFWWNEFIFDPATDRETKLGTVRCAVTPLGDKGEGEALCFYKDSGLLMRTNTPKKIGSRLGEYVCQYGDYQKFGEYVFPRVLACFEDGHRTLQGKIVELSSDPAPDATLFMPPAGAAEFDNSVDHPTPPRRQPPPDKFPF